MMRAPDLKHLLSILGIAVSRWSDRKFLMVDLAANEQVQLIEDRRDVLYGASDLQYLDAAAMQALIERHLIELPQVAIRTDEELLRNYLMESLLSAGLLGSSPDNAVDTAGRRSR